MRCAIIIHHILLPTGEKKSNPPNDRHPPTLSSIPQNTYLITLPEKKRTGSIHRCSASRANQQWPQSMWALRRASRQGHKYSEARGLAKGEVPVELMRTNDRSRM
ncbi:hypothetical protein CDAR_490471 [Caerostris darwini]|uniref:Uncharacterized protein n=1 Tax=Caerostris darwini TaxID=1538125 RepID=A0AAV4NJ67_9ARAC|nr:hypothetical protein CDAR_490471 [Caerostris darwini]